MSREQASRESPFQEFLGLIETQGKFDDFIQKYDQTNELISEVIKNLEAVITSEGDENIYSGLFRLYQYGNHRCQMFVMQFAPTLISVYFSVVGRRMLSGAGKLETLLLSIYNKEAAANTETPFSKSFRIPSLSNSSVYHEPGSTSSSTLTERALTRHEQSDNPVLFNAPNKLLDRILSSSRSDILNTILQVYNSNLAAMTEPSLIEFCKMVLRYARSGFPQMDLEDERLTNLLDRTELDAIKHYTRLKLSTDVLQQMIHGLYFIMHNGLAEMAVVAIENLEYISRHTLNAALSMTLNAVTDLIRRSNEDRYVPLSRNPYKSTRRPIDVSKRRYAFSTGQSVPNVTITTDFVDVESITASKQNTNNAISREDQYRRPAVENRADASLNKGSETTHTENRAVSNGMDEVDNTESTSGADHKNMPLVGISTDNANRLSSFSDDEAVNENTSLLRNESENSISKGKNGSVRDVNQVKVKVISTSIETVKYKIDSIDNNEIEVSRTEQTIVTGEKIETML